MSAKRYVAIQEAQYSAKQDCYSGTLPEILDGIEGDGEDHGDYTFYELGTQVKVELEKKLVLVVK